MRLAVKRPAVAIRTSCHGRPGNAPVHGRKITTLGTAHGYPSLADINFNRQTFQGVKHDFFRVDFVHVVSGIGIDLLAAECRLRAVSLGPLGWVGLGWRRPEWGRTGFDHVSAPEAACRGWFVGLVKNRTKKLRANEELALAA